MSIKSSIKDAALTAGGLMAYTANPPGQYGDKNYEYMAATTKSFIQARAKYASDFVTAQAQGLDPTDIYAWQTRRLRLSDIIRPSASFTRRIDNYKIILFEDRDVEYITPGSKIVTMGSTWLVTNPINLSGGDGSGICERCNAVWNHLDYYGNIVSEPIVVENSRANANDSDPQDTALITKGYFNVNCQYNPDTAQIDTNTRMILGSGCWRVTGFADFLQEFTGDYSTVRMLEFTVRYEEPNDAIDDMENHVAGGKTFSWEIQVSGVPAMQQGGAAAFSATSIRCGDAVSSGGQYPVTYLWSSTDEDILTVDAAGNVTAVGEGSAEIVCTLEQNQNISSAYPVTVTAADAGSGVRFLSGIPDTLRAFDEITLEAAYFDAGERTDEELEWKFTGAQEGSYGVLTGPRAVTVYGYGYSAAPLVVTASYGEYSASAEITLEGL